MFIFSPALYGNEATIVNSKIIGCFYVKFEILKESLLLAEKYISDTVKTHIKEPQF